MNNPNILPTILGTGRDPVDYASMLPQQLLHGDTEPDGTRTYSTGGSNSGLDYFRNRVFTQSQLNNAMSGNNANAIYNANAFSPEARDNINRASNLVADMIATRQVQQDIQRQQQQANEALYGNAIGQLLQNTPQGQSILAQIFNKPMARQRNITGASQGNNNIK